MQRFCERVRGLAEKLAMILIQLPPDCSPRALPALEKFLPQLPSDVRFAVEFRDPHWLLDEVGEVVLELFTAHRVALALVDSQWLPRERMLELAAQPTADFSYVRWLGPRALTSFAQIQIQRDNEFAQWRQAFAQLTPQVGAIFGYFNNHYQGHSPGSANQFKQLLGQSVVLPETLEQQLSLF